MGDGDLIRLPFAIIIKRDRQGGREAGRQGGREAGRQGGRETGRQGDRETGRQGDREAGREAGRQGGREEGQPPSESQSLSKAIDFRSRSFSKVDTDARAGHCQPKGSAKVHPHRNVST